jgi:hypothetical protein
MRSHHDAPLCSKPSAQTEQARWTLSRRDAVQPEFKGFISVAAS